MHYCLFCGEELKPKDVLFGMRKDSKTTVGGQQNQEHKREDKTNFDNKSGFLNPEEEGDSETITEAESEFSAEDANLGCWVLDKPYGDFLKKYLYMDIKTVYKEQLIFAVRWSGEDACHGRGKAVKMEKNKQLPLDVQLCPEDAEACDGYEFLTRCFCPHCHCEIMQGYFDTPEDRIHNIAFVGGSRAGKTQYITAVYQNLSSPTSMLSRAYRMGDVEFDPLSEGVMRYLSDVLSGKLTNADVADTLIDTTESDASADSQSGRGKMETTKRMPILPIVMKITRDNRTGVVEVSKDFGVETETDISFIALYDCPGEIFDRRYEYELPNNKGLRLAESLLFLADSAQLFQTLFDAAEDNPAVKQDTCMLDLSGMLLRLRERFGHVPFKAVSFVVTKIDKVIDNDVCSLSRTNRRPNDYLKVLMSRDYQDHKGAVDLNAIEIIDNTMRFVLETNSADDSDGDERETPLAQPGIINRLENCFACCDKNNIKVFAISTWQRRDDNSPFEICGEASMNRHRLLEPILYLLAKLEVLPSITGREEPDPKPERRHGFFSRFFG